MWTLSGGEGLELEQADGDAGVALQHNPQARVVLTAEKVTVLYWLRFTGYPLEPPRCRHVDAAVVIEEVDLRAPQ